MNRMTNFALMMQVLALTPSDIAQRLGADTTLVSRWRTGSRRIMPDRHWADEIAQMLFQEDAKRRMPLLPRLMQAYEPDLDLESVTDVTEAIRQFLTVAGQMEPGYHQHVVELINTVSAGEMEPILVDAAWNKNGSMNVVGYKAVRKLVLDFFEYAVKLGRGEETVLCCTDHLATLLEDPKNKQRLTRLMDKAQKSGCSLKIVFHATCTSETIAPLWGTLMQGQLNGHFDSAFRADYQPDGEKILGAVRGRSAISVNTNTNGRGAVAMLHAEPQEIEKVFVRANEYAMDADVWSHNRFLADSGDFLCDVSDYHAKPCYLFSRMPQFGFLQHDEYASFYRIDPKQAQALCEQCPMLVHPVSNVPGHVPVRHVFCQEAIDEVLLEARRMVPSLTEFCGQRVFMTAKKLVEALKMIRALLVKHKNYEVCFLPEGTFVDFSMNVVSWGDASVVAWSNGRSTAAKATRIANAAHIFCSRAWDCVPSTLRSRAAAIKHIDQWLKKAKLYGLEV